MNDLFCQMRCIGVCILRRNTEQNEIARSDLAMQHPINMDGCLLNTRDYCSQHITSFYLIPLHNVLYYNTPCRGCLSYAEKKAERSRVSAV